MSDLYSVMEKLFEKGNYKGCDTIGRNTLKTTEGKIPIKGRKFNGVNNRQVVTPRYYVCGGPLLENVLLRILKKMRKLRGTALRRIYGLDEDFDAKLSQLKREVGQFNSQQRHKLFLTKRFPLFAGQPRNCGASTAHARGGLPRQGEGNS